MSRDSRACQGLAEQAREHTCQVDKCGVLQAVVRSCKNLFPRANQDMLSHIYRIATLIDNVNLQVESGVALWWVCQTAQPNTSITLCGWNILRNFSNGSVRLRSQHQHHFLWLESSAQAFLAGLSDCIASSNISLSGRETLHRISGMLCRNCKSVVIRARPCVS